MSTKRRIVFPVPKCLRYRRQTKRKRLGDNTLTCNGICFVVSEAEVWVEVRLDAQGFIGPLMRLPVSNIRSWHVFTLPTDLQLLVSEPPLDGHDKSQHLVVGATRKHDMAREELVKTKANRPEIDSSVVW